MEPHALKNEDEEDGYADRESANTHAAGIYEASLANDTKTKSRNRPSEPSGPVKRRCVSTACIACRRRKSKCDGNTPSCAACASVYGTECIYDPNSDHRRKGVYKKDIDNLKTRNSTLHTLLQAILSYPEDEAFDLVRQIRSSGNLDDVAESIVARENGVDDDEDDLDSSLYAIGNESSVETAHTFESELSGKMGELRLENGSVKYIGGTSNLIFVGSTIHPEEGFDEPSEVTPYQQEAPITSWTTVTSDLELFKHLMNMYFNWHYPYFTTLSKSLFYRDFLLGKPSAETRRKTEYCTPLLVNAMLALGCHFSSWPGARADPNDSATAGDHFFREAKSLTLGGDEHEKPRLATVQALALMSVREAGCGREGSGWVYSGMSFRMACDLGLNVDSEGLTYHKESGLNEEEIDARRITFWGCFLFDKCWSNYLGRQPQLPVSSLTVPKFDVFPVEDAALWSPYTDAGSTPAHSQPARTRAVALRISSLCEISNDLLIFFYHPTHRERPMSKSAELKKLSELHTRLEAWRRDLPKEMEPREGALPPVLLMHMFYQLLFIHLFRPFLRYNQATSPLPPHISPRKLCTQAACLISKLLRLYKRTYGLRQICNVAVYILHTACTIHLLNLPDKTAKRDIFHGVKHLEEIAEGWLCARRTLGILSVLINRWNIDLPDEAIGVLGRAEAKFGPYPGEDGSSPRTGPGSPHSAQSASSRGTSQSSTPAAQLQVQSMQGGMIHGVINGPNTGTQGGISDMPDGRPNEMAARMANPMSGNIPSGMTNGASNDVGALQGRRPNEAVVFGPTSGKDHPQASGAPLYAAAQNLPQTYQTTWESAGSSIRSLTSPSTVFMPASAPGPVQDAQDWWLKDPSALADGFENWNGLDSSAAMMAESMNDVNFGIHGQPFGGFGNNPSGGNANSTSNNEWYG
ncbi:MAG: hypothetical protein M1832_006119 [Thelocarpon impressellum]|nr:MAG: hypothetical protein M1832_006119 [Thelocarpon impressellum]